MGSNNNVMKRNQGAAPNQGPIQSNFASLGQGAASAAGQMFGKMQKPQQQDIPQKQGIGPQLPGAMQQFGQHISNGIGAGQNPQGPPPEMMNPQKEQSLRDIVMARNQLGQSPPPQMFQPQPPQQQEPMPTRQMDIQPQGSQQLGGMAPQYGALQNMMQQFMQQRQQAAPWQQRRPMNQMRPFGRPQQY